LDQVGDEWRQKFSSGHERWSICLVLLSERLQARPATGAEIWHYSPGCSGGGGKTPALYDGRLYVRDFSDTIFDANTGSITGNFNAKNTPAFSGSRGFF
jgi:outer membrane protein assembly factor BamB